MAFRLRCRGPEGQFILQGLSMDCTVKELLLQCAEKSGVSVDQIKLVNASQMPHIDVQVSDTSKTLKQVGIRSGDSLIIIKEESAPQPVQMNISQPVQSNGGGKHTNEEGRIDPYVQTKGGEYLIRREIPSDNSCLFNAVGYVMERQRQSQAKLRKIIAQEVSNDEVYYNEGFLEKQNNEYCNWILNDQRWGGAIELAILSKHYGRKIAAFDIRSQRCDIYGEDKDYNEIVLLIYDGLHYDALVVSPVIEDGLDEFDTTVFECNSYQTQQVLEAASSLVKRYAEAHQFTDTANFTLQCAQCKQGLQGEAEARQHAAQTGHVNFQEYR